MTTIYCDASYDDHAGLCVWACLIFTPAGKQFVHTGYYNNYDSASGELRAVVKALGKVKAHKGRILVYSDFILLSEAAETRGRARFHALAREDTAWLDLWHYLCTMQSRLELRYIPRKENLAHKYAIAELRRLRAEQSSPPQAQTTVPPSSPSSPPYLG